VLLLIDHNTKNYDWGSKTLIPNFFSLDPSDQKISELWFGTHSQGESQVAGQPLSKAIGTQLGFLVKFLSADSPLSIQVHPNSAQALAGFEKENQLGLALTDPTRNYKDSLAKPELLVALTPFRALCGFREVSEIRDLFGNLGALEPKFLELASLLDQSDGLRKVFERLLDDVELAESFEALAGIELASKESASARDLAIGLLQKYPGDPGALIAMLLNDLQLEAGDAIFMPAGSPHAYLSGLGLEVMAASDNVIRGGLTSKHIDKPELLRTVDFQPLGNPRVRARLLAQGLLEFETAASEFRVYKVVLSSTNLLADLDLPQHAIVVCTRGELVISTSLEERLVLKKSQAAFVSKAKKISLIGSGEGFVVLGS
jgi:mannose-6-phosphate isomerase